MFKKLNKKGFTLIELLAVIIILALLIAVAVPAVTRYLSGARKDTYVSNAKAAIQAVADDVTINGMKKTKYTLTDINALLDTELKESPFGQAYSDGSYVAVAEDSASGKYTYSICLVDDGNNGFSGTDGAAVSYDNLTRDNVKTGDAEACK